MTDSPRGRLESLMRLACCGHWPHQFGLRSAPVLGKRPLVHASTCFVEGTQFSSLAILSKSDSSLKQFTYALLLEGTQVVIALEDAAKSGSYENRCSSSCQDCSSIMLASGLGTVATPAEAAPTTSKRTLDMQSQPCINAPMRPKSRARDVLGRLRLDGCQPHGRRAALLGSSALVL